MHAFFSSSFVYKIIEKNTKLSTGVCSRVRPFFFVRESVWKERTHINTRWRENMERNRIKYLQRKWNPDCRMHWKRRNNKIVIESDGFTYWLFLLSWAVSVLCTGYLLYRWKWRIEAVFFRHSIFKCGLCSPIIAFYWTFCFEQRRILCCFSCSFLRIDYLFHLFHSCCFVYW